MVALELKLPESTYAALQQAATQAPKKRGRSSSGSYPGLPGSIGGN